MRSSTSVPLAGRAARRVGVRGDQDPGRADLALDVPVLVEPPVHQVLVVGHGDVEGDHQPPGPPDLDAGPLVDVLPQDPAVLLVDADRVRYGPGLAAGVVHHRVQVGDLTQAVAAQGQRGGHEAQAPLADVERGPPVVVRAGVPVGHDHLGERQPVRDRAQPSRVAEPDLVQHQALAVVEPQPELPVLPAQLVAVEGEADPGRLADFQWRHLAQRHGNEPRQVLAHHVRGIAVLAAVLEFEQRHRIQVDHRVQAGDVVSVRVALLAGPGPDVAPAQPESPVALGDERGAVGPHVGQHQGHVGDPAPR